MLDNMEKINKIYNMCTSNDDEFVKLGMELVRTETGRECENIHDVINELGHHAFLLGMQKGKEIIKDGQNKEYKNGS